VWIVCVPKNIEALRGKSARYGQNIHYTIVECPDVGKVIVRKKGM
jgi:hypothetical protein